MGNWRLQDSARETLTLFRERALEFSTRGAFPFTFGGSISVTAEKVTATAELPDEDLVRSAAMTARLFVQQDEPTHLPKICNILHLSATEESQRDAVAAIRRVFTRSLRHECSIQMDGVKTHHDLLNAVLNGAYFHSDPKLRAIAKQLEEGAGLLIKQEFTILLFDIRGSVEAMLALVEDALGIASRTVPGLHSIRTFLEARGKKDVDVKIIDEQTTNGDKTERILTVQLDCPLSAKEADEIHFACVVILRDAYPFRHWYALEWRNKDGSWHPAAAVSPYPRFP